MADANITKDALEEAVNLGQKIGQPILTEAIHYAIVPHNAKVESLKNLQYPHGLLPDRIIQSVQLRDADSFAKYVLAYTDVRTRVFAEPKNNTFLAVLDYHGIGNEPEFLSHNASFQMTFDDRWVTWSGKSEKVFNQADFAEFIEDNIADIAHPPGAVMLEVARELHASSEMNFSSKVTPKNGQVQFSYTENLTTQGVNGGKLEVPDFFTLRIPIFYGEEPIEVLARLRFRISSGKLTFFYKLQRQSEIVSTAFDYAVASVADALKTDVLLGGPQ